MASVTEGPRAADIEFLFEALNYATTPVTINIALLGAAKEAKPNTLGKRISVIAKRYNLNITTTTKGDVSAPVTPGKPKAVAAKPSVTKKRKVAAKAMKVESHEEDEAEMSGQGSGVEVEHGSKKQKTGNANLALKDEGGDFAIAEDDVAEEEVA